MAGFGGSVKLVGATQYKNDLKQIGQRLREVTAEMKSQTSAFDKNDTSQAALEARSKALNKVLQEQGNKVKTLAAQYQDFQKRTQEQTSNHQKLVAQYEAAQQELKRIGATLGTTSDAYKQQEEKVNALAAAVKKSSEAEEHNAKRLSETKIELENANAAYNKTNTELKKVDSQLKETTESAEDFGEEIKDTGKEAERAANDGFTVFKGMLADLSSRAVASAINGVKKLGSAFIDVGKQSVQSYAKYEQLAGGVETLFGKSAKIVQEYAQNAYKTAQMSANDYMENVTGFSATLLQGLGGDTKKAAEYADMAIKDMADNANKMGTSMESITYAYQGFAKDNYTMLDNLKLGYGGTQAEMARLVNESGVMGRSFKATAKNIKDIPFDKLIEAIHKTQERMGITGTTAKEASHTVEGSVNAMKASWSNLLTAIADDNADLEKSVDQFVDSAINAGKNLVPRIKTIVESIKRIINGIVTEVFPKLKKEIPELEPLISTFEWFIKNRALVVNAIGAIVAAFAVKKVLEFGSTLSGVVQTLGGIASGAQVYSKSVGGLIAATTSATSATGGLTVATNLLKAAWAANPIGMIAVGVGAAVAAFGLLKTAMDNAQRPTNEIVEKNKELKKSYETLQEGIEETKKAYQDNVKEVEDNATSAQFLMKRLEALEKVEHKSVSQKEEMANIVKQLNNILPDLNLEYDKEKDSLNQSTEAIRKNIDASKELALAKAEQKFAEGIVTKIAEAERNAADATKNYQKATEEATKATEAREKAEEEYLKDTWNPGKEAAYNSALAAEQRAKKAMNDSKTTVDEYNNTLEDLNDQYDTSMDKASEYAKKADISTAMAKLTDQAKKAGREIPQALANGMKAGIYAVPASMEEMDKLINFDTAIHNAGLAGQQIPASISQGVMQGKTSIEDAIAQAKAVIDLADTVQGMIDQGKALPTNLAQGIREGTITVEEANAQMEAAIKFDELKQKATEAGAAIPANLAEQVTNGTITVTEANNQLQASLDYATAVQKATEAGIAIPTTLAEQITLGELAPNEALQRVQSLLDYTKSFNEAGLSGKAIPNALRDGILSGEMSVDAANTAMNNWIQFKQANNEAAKAGVKVPSELATNIIKGKVTVDDANKQMNNWIQFQAAVKEAGLEGAEVPKELASKILAGKTKPTDAIKELNKAIGDQAKDAKKQGEEVGKAVLDGDLRGVGNSSLRKQIKDKTKSVGKDDMVGGLKDGTDSHSPSKEAQKIGGYFLDGVYNGVNNGSKRSSIFSSIYSLGTSMLARMKASLKEKSPSKATREMGEFLLEGLSIGMESEEKGLLNQISGLGQRMLGTLDDELATGISTNALANLQSAIPSEFNANIGTSAANAANVAQAAHSDLVGAFKEALSQMKIEMDSEEMGSFVDKTVTRLVYN